VPAGLALLALVVQLVEVVVGEGDFEVGGPADGRRQRQPVAVTLTGLVNNSSHGSMTPRHRSTGQRLIGAAKIRNAPFFIALSSLQCVLT
jgi:hypothetical protein